MNRPIILFVIVVGLASPSAYGQQDHVSQDSLEFASLKSLVGHWQGSTDDGKTEASVIYKLTGRGTSIVETLFPETSMEMVTIYHDDATGSLVAKHFCVAMNQPQLRLTRAAGNELFFEHMPDDPNVNEAVELHGHDLSLTYDGGNKLQLEWFNREKGAPIGSRRYEFTRVD